MMYAIGVAMCLVWFVCGVMSDREYLRETHQLKGVLIGQVSETYELTGAEINVEIYDAGVEPKKCVFWKGERGQVGMTGRGGDGASGMMCGGSIAVLPGHGGFSR
jgi:hypothetical protein